MRKFKRVYITNPENVSLQIWDSMIMCSSSNWDYYFLETDGNHEEIIKNVTFVEFDDSKDLIAFLEKNKVIDYSFEHEKPCVLI